jgi:hypothetical protein
MKEQAIRFKFKRFAKGLKEDQWSPTDPFGSYTGRAKDSGEVPVQDADDI